MLTMYGCRQLLRPGGTVVFVTRLLRRGGQFVDLSFPVKDAAEWAGLDLIERAVALRVPIRDSRQLSRRPSRRGQRRGATATPQRIVYDDVLVYRVPTRWQRWLKGELG